MVMYLGKHSVSEIHIMGLTSLLQVSLAGRKEFCTIKEINEGYYQLSYYGTVRGGKGCRIQE